MLALFNVVLHLLFLNNLEYHRDELLYFSLGLHPAAGFATVPPMIGWVAWLMQNIFGYSLFAVKIFPALMSGAMVILLSEITRELGGNIYARVLSAAGLILSVFGLRTFFLFQPVHLDLFFWSLIIYLVIRYVNSSDGKYLILLGFVAGLSLLNKYLIGLLFISLFVVIIFTQHRKILIERKFWIGIMIGALVFLPNIIWQFANGLPVFRHFSELNSSQLVNVDRTGFMIDQLLMAGIASVLTIAGLIWLLLTGQGAKYRFLGVVVVLVIGSLLMLKGKSYYTLGVFPLLLAAGAVSLEKSIKKTWMKVVFLLMLVLLSIPAVPIGIPVYKAEGLIKYFSDLETKYGIVVGRRFEDGSIHSLPQDYADMLGWEELTSIVNKAYLMTADKKASFIFCQNYGQAGAITVIGKKYGLPEPVSFNESFLYWFPERFDQDITSLIYINSEVGKDLGSIFDKITLVGKISNPDAREFGTGVYLCELPKGSFNEFWAVRVKQVRKEN
jgi:hypothetical protein